MQQASGRGHAWNARGTIIEAPAAVSNRDTVEETVSRAQGVASRAASTPCPSRARWPMTRRGRGPDLIGRRWGADVCRTHYE